MLARLSKQAQFPVSLFEKHGVGPTRHIQGPLVRDSGLSVHANWAKAGPRAPARAGDSRNRVWQGKGGCLLRPPTYGGQPCGTTRSFSAHPASRRLHWTGRENCTGNSWCCGSFWLTRLHQAETRRKQAPFLPVDTAAPRAVPGPWRSPFSAGLGPHCPLPGGWGAALLRPRPGCWGPGGPDTEAWQQHGSARACPAPGEAVCGSLAVVPLHFPRQFPTNTVLSTLHCPFP